MALSNQFRKISTAEQMRLTRIGASRGANLWAKSLPCTDLEPVRENGWKSFCFAG